MIEKISCPSKTRLSTLITGKKSQDQSASERDFVAKEVQPILTVEPSTDNLIPSPKVESCLPSPTWTTTPETVIQKTCEPGASDATSNMTLDITLKTEEKELVLSATTASPRYLIGKKNKSIERSKELQRVLRNDESQMTMYQIQLEHWRPFTDRVKASIDIWGCGARVKGGEYAVRALQISAAAQTKGLNDPNASPGQRLMMATALYKGKETYDDAFQQGLDKTEWKKQWKDKLSSVSEFFGLGNKKDVAARNKRK